MRCNLIGAVLIALLLTMTSQTNAQTVLFDFRSNGGAGVAGIDPKPNFDPAMQATSLPLKLDLA